MKYVLIEDGNNQIKIIDNSTKLGKSRVEKMIVDGCKHVGFLESEENPLHLMSCFNKTTNNKLEKALNKLSGIYKILND